MNSEIAVKKEYILVEPPNGIKYWEILEAIGRLRNMDEFPEKNYIWKFSDGPVMLLYSDLYKIKDIINVHYPKNAKQKKTALVVETGLQYGMAEEFANILKDLSCDIRVFSNLRSAEKWVKK